MRALLFLLLLLSLLLLLALLMQQSSSEPEPGPAPGSTISTTAPPNVLLILADDLGVEHVEFHPVGRATGSAARTPYLNSLASQAAVYTDFYATPICSTTRASLLTGRLPFRHGLSRNLVQGEPGLSEQEITLAEQLALGGYRTGAFGKWHVSFSRSNPRDQGFEVFDGSLLNLSGGGGSGYYKWVHTRNGESSLAEHYATSATTDAAVNWIRERRSDAAPWFAYVAYHAPHAPFEPPPAQLNPFTQAKVGDPKVVIYHGMVEALDNEIARLMREIDLRDTLVIFVGDNGSPPAVVQGPVLKGKAKHTTYEGGIRVPAMVAGAGMTLAPGEYGGPVHIVDLFNTILDLTSTPRVDPQVAVLDSVSLLDPELPVSARWLPHRDTLFTERFGPNSKQPSEAYSFLWRSVRGPRYKLLRTLKGDQFFDLWDDPWELSDLTQDDLSPALKLEYRALAARIQELVDA